MCENNTKHNQQTNKQTNIKRRQNQRKVKCKLHKKRKLERKSSLAMETLPLHNMIELFVVVLTSLSVIHHHISTFLPFKRGIRFQRDTKWENWKSELVILKTMIWKHINENDLLEGFFFFFNNKYGTRGPLSLRAETLHQEENKNARKLFNSRIKNSSWKKC